MEEKKLEVLANMFDMLLENMSDSEAKVLLECAADRAFVAICNRHMIDEYNPIKQSEIAAELVTSVEFTLRDYVGE